ncbi:hypothetical protein BJF84_14265 [Rhodococcus sp. CUA-806]|nr:hypothetical protein BJF84_14265 [Rhodococcus sp. CUA-806]
MTADTQEKRLGGSTSRRPEPLLLVDGLDVTIGDRKVLTDIAFEIRRGEVLGVIGASGSGKSMTASAITGLAPDSADITGSIRFDGTELTALDDRQMCRFRGNRMAYIHQDPMGSLTPTRTIAATWSRRSRSINLSPAARHAVWP